MKTQNKNIEKNWDAIKTKVKAKWDKFSDKDIEAVKQDFNSLSGKLEKTYSLKKEAAEKQFSEFKSSIDSLLSEQSASKPGAAQVTKPHQAGDK